MTKRLIRTYSKYGDPRQLAQLSNDGSEVSEAERARQTRSAHRSAGHLTSAFDMSDSATGNDRNPHGMSPDEIADMHRRFDEASPQLHRQGDARRNWVQELLGDAVPGAVLDEPRSSRRGASSRQTRRGQLFGANFGGGNGSGGNSTFTSPMRPYQPEFTRARQSYPISRILANRYWRIFYKMDPTVGTCIDMISDLVWSAYQLTGEGVDGEVKDRLDQMDDLTQLRMMLPYFIREFLVTGEAHPHLFFDEELKLWSHIALHNPDQLEIIYSPFIPMDPVAEFVPDDRLRQVVTSPNPQLRRIREMMPPELIAKLSARKNITLNPLNYTFIPRKLHPYDVRGTSLLSRLWQTFDAEDALWDSFIATARRACFVAGTPVLTMTGLKAIEEVKPGDKVISGSGSVEMVEAAWEEPASEAGLVEIKATGTRPIYCTPNHAFKAWVAPRNCACGCGTPIEAQYEKTGKAKRRAFITGHHLFVNRDVETGRMKSGPALEWKEYSQDPKVRAPANYEPLRRIEAKDLRVGDYLVIPRTFKERATDTTPEAARLLGYFAAEGSNRKVWSGKEEKHHVSFEGASFCFSLEEYDTWATDVMRCAESLGLSPNLSYCPAKPGSQKALSGRVGETKVHLQRQCDRSFTNWLKENAGLGANNHILSEEVMCWPLALKRELLIGYFRGDGHFGFPDAKCMTCPQVTAGSTSRTLIYQIRVILAQLGVFGSISYNPKGDKPDEENWEDMWIISSTGRDARILAKMIWGVDVKSSRENGNKKGGGSRTWSDDQYIYVPITSCEALDDTVPTYNLSVTGDHSYLVEIIQTFNSRPIKVLKMGDPNTNYIPGKEQEQKMLSLLTQAENDPEAWVVCSFANNFEMVGDPQRALNIGNSYDLIERIKLIALGVSKSFLTGDSSYANSAAGLTVFLQRLLAMREFFENAWIYPKYYKRAAVLNNWIKPTEAELAHNVRTKRSHRELEDDDRYIVPTIEWEKSLDPAANTERISALQGLAQLGIKVSRRTALATVGLDFEQELKQIKAEQKTIKEVIGNDLQVAAAAGVQLPGMAPIAPGEEGGGAGGGMPSMSVSPGLPEGSLGEFGPEQGGGSGNAMPGQDTGMPGQDTGAPLATPGGMAEEGAAGESPQDLSKSKKDKSKQKTEEFHDTPIQSIWSPELTKPLLALFDQFDYAELDEPWDRMLEASPPAQHAVKMEDPHALWEAIQQWLIDEGYPTRAITDLEDLLSNKGKIVRAQLGSESRQADGRKSNLATMDYEKLLARVEEISADNASNIKGIPSSGFWTGLSAGRKKPSK